MLPALSTFAIFAAAVLAAFVWIAAGGLSLTWLVLGMGGLAGAAGLVWWGNLRQALFLGFVVTVPIELGKALISEGGVYAPGLSVLLYDLFLLGYLTLWLFEKLIVRREGVRLSKLHGFAFAFTAAIWVSASMSPDALSGVLAALHHTKYLVVFIAVCDELDDPRQIRPFLAALALGLVFQLAMAYAQAISGSSLAIQGAKASALTFEAAGVEALRPRGLLPHANHFASYLVFLLPPLFGLSLMGPNRISRAVWLISVALFLAGCGALVLTLSRGGWIALGAALALFSILGLVRRVLAPRHVAGVVLAGIFGVGLSVLIYPTAYLRIVSFDDYSSESRWIMMDQALDVIRRHPVLGTGLGAYRDAVSVDLGASVTGQEQRRQLLRKGFVHNKYLLVMAEQGVFGLLLFVALLWQMVRPALRLRRWGDPAACAVGLGIVASIFGQCVFFLVEHFNIDVRILLLWIAAGVLLALTRSQVSQTGKPPG